MSYYGIELKLSYSDCMEGLSNNNMKIRSELQIQPMECLIKFMFKIKPMQKGNSESDCTLKKESKEEAQYYQVRQLVK